MRAHALLPQHGSMRTPEIDAGTAPAHPPRAVIASGAARYADPWHPFAETSGHLAAVLRADGWSVEVVKDPDVALTRLEGAALLVVNAGDPWLDPGARRFVSPSAREGLDAAIARGIGLLAIHSALSSLRDYPAWRAAIGGSWEDGTSRHPEIGEARVRIVDATHPITAGMDDMELFDERYTDLVLDDGLEVLAAHELDGTRHPLVWVREQPTRACVCALGHDARAYASPALRTIIARAARWTARLD